MHGNYCALIIHSDGNLWGFCDRFGAKTLYWQTTQDKETIIASRWNEMPVFKVEWDDLGVAETLRYRWMSQLQTMVAGIYKLPLWHRVQFSNSGEISIRDTAQNYDWTKSSPAKPFSAKLDETRSALNDSIADISRSYDKAAVPLSGGVDSSLVAALSKAYFEECLLVTPVFDGDKNPELPAAKAAAKSLNLEHLLVQIDPDRLERDLRECVGAKGGQVLFHSLVMHQIMDAIPEEFRLIVFGEAADILFGTDPFKRTETLLYLKRFTDLLPDFVMNGMSRLPIRRVRNASEILRRSDIDATLEYFQIQYDPASMAIIRGLCKSELKDLYGHLAVTRRRSRREIPLRGFLQDINFRTSAVNHYRDIDVSATRYDKHVFKPFLSEPVIDAAKALTKDQYYGKKQAKPILRELACEHFDRDLINRKKQGFLVPFVDWLEGPLAHLVEATKRERDLFDGRLLEDFDVAKSFSLYWTLINWQLLNQKIAAKC